MAAQPLDVRIGRLELEIGRLTRLTGDRRAAHERVFNADADGPQVVRQLVGRAHARAQHELAARPVVLEDRAALGCRQLDGATEALTTMTPEELAALAARLEALADSQSAANRAVAESMRNAAAGRPD